MIMARAAGFGPMVLLAAGLMTGCISDGEIAAGPDATHTSPEERATVAAELTHQTSQQQATRTEEGGVTVIRGTVPPALMAMASTMPVQDPTTGDFEPRPSVSGPASGGSLVAAAMAQGSSVQTAAAAGALASVEQLAALQAQPATPVVVAELADNELSQVSPAAGSASVTSLTGADDPIVQEVLRRAANTPISIRDLEANGATRMSTEEIAAFTVGNTLTHTNAATGFTVATYYDPSGESRLINEGRALPGRYQITDGARCRIDMQGLGVCALLYRQGDTTWVCDQRDQGMCNWVVSRVEAGLVGG